MDIGQQILGLKQEIAKATQLRATAEGGLAVAQQQLDDVDAKLTALGITPDNADTELSALETELTTLVTSLREQVEREVEAYSAIVASSKAAFQGDR